MYPIGSNSRWWLDLSYSLMQQAGQAFAGSNWNTLSVDEAQAVKTALVFNQFVDCLRLLRVPLDEACIIQQYLDGATPAAYRTRRVAAFQAGVGDLFLISLKAGGFRLSLRAADYVVIADPWWNLAAEDHAMGRAHRMGQLRPVTVYRMVSKGTSASSNCNMTSARWPTGFWPRVVKPPACHLTLN